MQVHIHVSTSYVRLHVYLIDRSNHAHVDLLAQSDDSDQVTHVHVL